MRLRVCLVQLPVRPPGEAERALEDALAAIQEGADRGASLVVLPKAAGFAAPAVAGRPAAGPPWPTLVRLVGGAARQAGVYTVAGFERAVPGEAGPGQPVIGLFDRSGALVATAAAAARPGTAAPVRPKEAALGPEVVDTAIGRLGLLLGDDLVDPVPARRMAEAGVCALLVPSALEARSREAAAERQVAIDRPRARARENGIAVLVADWSGKSGTHRLLGTTAAYGPGGTRLAMVAPGRAGVCVCELDLPLPLLRRSRGARLPTPPPHPPSRPRRRLVVAVAQGPDHGSWVLGAAPFAAHLLVAPLPPRGLGPTACVARTSVGRVRVMVPGRATREVVRGERFVAGHRVVDAGSVSVGVLFADEITAPEPARLLASAGAQVLVLFHESLDVEDSRFWSRVRARENGVAVVVSGRPQGTIVAPDGHVAAEGALRRSAVVGAGVTVGGARRRVTSASRA